MKKRLSIAWKLFIVYLIITVPLVIIIGATYSIWYNARLESVLLNRLELARLTGNSFLLFTRDINRTMKAICRAIIDNKYSKSQAESALRELHTDYPIAYAFFTDPAGKVIFSTDPRLIGKNLSKHKAFIEITTEKKTRGIDNNEQFLNYTGFHITQAIMDKERRLQGIVSAFVDISRLPQVIPVKVEAGGVNIVDSSGHLVFQSEFPNLAKEMAFWGDYEFIRTALSGKDSFTRNFVFPVTGRIRIGSEVPIPDLGWTSGSLINVDEAVGPLKQDIIIAASATITIAFIALGVSFFVARRIIRSLASLVDKARLVGEGRFEEPVLLKTGDEVEDVARSLDETRLNLKRHIEELQILSEISGVVALTLNLKELIEQAADKVVQLLEADAITFYLIDEESKMLKLFTHQGVSEAYLERFSVIKLKEDLTGKVAESVIPLAAKANQSDSSEPGSTIIDGICAPVKARGKTIGAMAIGTKYRRQFTERDFALLSAIGNLIGTAVENARLFERERDIAEVLQKSLLGKAPVIPGFEIGVAYESAVSEAADVGGDFFDFIEFADGTIGVVIGDVSGKGIEAATLTAIAKNTVRAFAYENNSPGDVLTRVNEVLTASTGAEEFVTLLFVLLDVKSGLIRIASAAHPPAFICNGDCVLPTAVQGLPLGAFSDTKYTDTLVEIKKGQSLILYTDGLTDARSDGKMFGEEGIGRIASEYKMTMNAQELADYLVKEAKDFAGGRLVDDVAVIVLKVLGSGHPCINSLSPLGRGKG